MIQKSKVAVIGLGNIGAAVATNLVKGNRSVILADKTFEKANVLSQKLGSLTHAATIADAVKEADIVVLAIYFDPIKDFLKTYATALEGKIIVDPSNPIAPDENGGFKKIIGEDESAGQLLSALVPNGAELVKALGTLGAATLASASFQTPEKAVEFYATDNSSINAEIEELIRDNGFEPLRVGTLNQSIRIEVFGDLHEFGALGKAVTLNEAKLVV
ncbi:NADPH-dependent F420 reductase [Flavobacterium petrolei]|jgi:predicted dinucleotide-binding enzyme|uniref:NADPH-dependent F420 reductase n=1 Tax=Flavobacterium petrolei TaxID=2259594 RepID=UPI000BCF69B5|nr:NAD(P)-binding domain-containing protein [uncultured Flavobacterium sp.]OYX28127.1 MAG: NADP oxidoreductase coenzyme F420-dependent [Flavobacteriales bacterium 32-35-8]